MEVKSFFGLNNSQLFYALIAINVVASTLSFALGIYAGNNLILMPLLFSGWLLGSMLLLFIENGLVARFIRLHKMALNETKRSMRQNFEQKNLRDVFQYDDVSLKPYAVVFGVTLLMLTVTFLSGLYLTKEKGLENFKTLISTQSAS